MRIQQFAALGAAVGAAGIFAAPAPPLLGHAHVAMRAPTFSTYLGAEDWDGAFGVALDSMGNMYVSLDTGSEDFPVVKAFQAEYGGGSSDAAITKFRSDGSIAWSTFLGGSGRDYPYAIALAPDGGVVVVGVTQSANFPMRNAFQSRPGGSDGGLLDGFVSRFGPEGDLVYSSFIGGVDWEAVKAVAVDDEGRAWITGYTGSGNFPVRGSLEGALRSCRQGSITGCPDAFLARVSSDGSRLEFSALFGGRERDEGTAITLAGGYAYLTGSTASRDFPRVRAFQQNRAGETCSGPGSCYDAFVMRVNIESLAVDYSTYLGGTALDEGMGIAADSGGRAFVVGSSRSADFPNVRPIQQEHGGGVCTLGSERLPCRAIFVAVVAADGDGLELSSLIGGRTDDQARGASVDGVGRAWFSGTVGSPGLPVRSAFGSERLRGLEDAYVGAIDLDSGELVLGSYYGGSNEDQGTAISVTFDGTRLALVGGTTSTDFPLVSAVQSEYGGGDRDGFAVLVESPLAEPTPTPTATSSLPSPTNSPTPDGEPSATSVPRRHVFLPVSLARGQIQRAREPGSGVTAP